MFLNVREKSHQQSLRAISCQPVLVTRAPVLPGRLCHIYKNVWLPSVTPSPKGTHAGVGVVRMQAAPTLSTSGGKTRQPHFLSSSEPLCRFTLGQ